MFTVGSLSAVKQRKLNLTIVILEVDVLEDGRCGLVFSNEPTPSEVDVLENDSVAMITWSCIFSEAGARRAAMHTHRMYGTLRVDPAFFQHNFIRKARCLNMSERDSLAEAM